MEVRLGSLIVGAVIGGFLAYSSMMVTIAKNVIKVDQEKEKKEKEAE